MVVGLWRFFSFFFPLTSWILLTRTLFASKAFQFLVWLVGFLEYQQLAFLGKVVSAERNEM